MQDSPTQLTDAQIDHIYDTIKQVSIQYVGEKPENYIGLAEEDIDQLEQTYSLTFPKAYRKFLRNFPGAHLKIFDYQTYGMHGIADAHEVAEDLLLEDETKTILPSGAFPFSQWQGYQFYYFVNSGRDNPETYLYMEGGNANPPKIYDLGCFTDWLINLSISNINLYVELLGRATGEGVEKLKTLLIDAD